MLPLMKIWQVRSLSKFVVPRQSVWLAKKCKADQSVCGISVELVNKLERLALVNFGSQDSVRILEAAVRHADEMEAVIVPPESAASCVRVHDFDETIKTNLLLSADIVAQNESRSQIMSNAAKKLDNYFVSPLGNVALQQEGNKYGLEEPQPKT